jgi:HEAT repeat protein
LFEGLKDDKGMVREAAVQTLGTAGRSLPETVPALLEILEDEDPDVVLTAIDVLCDENGRPEIAEAIKKVGDQYENANRFKQKRVRKAAAKCLKKR